MPFATGADLPSETINEVLGFFAWNRYMRGGSPRESRTVDMGSKQLGACSLVCRYWAKLCRPHVFARLILRSREDFERFLELVDRPSVVFPSVTDCLRSVEVEQNDTGAMPWLHLLRAALLARPDIKFNRGIELHLGGTGSNPSNSSYAPRSLSMSLPKTLPGSMFPFALVTLKDLRFKRLSDFLRLVHDFTVTRFISCYRLQFDEPLPNLHLTTTRPRQRNVPGEPSFSSIRMRGLGDAEFEVGLMLMIGCSMCSHTTAFFREWARRMHKLALAIIPSNYSGGIFYLDRTALYPGISFYADPNSSVGDDRTARTVEVGFEYANGELVPRRAKYVRLMFEIESDMSTNWNTLEEISFGEFQAKLIKIRTERKKVFLGLVDAVKKGDILSGAHKTRRLQLFYLTWLDGMSYFSKEEMEDKYGVSMDNFLTAPSEYMVDGRAVALTPSQLIDFLARRRINPHPSQIENILRGLGFKGSDDCEQRTPLRPANFTVGCTVKLAGA